MSYYYKDDEPHGGNVEQKKPDTKEHIRLHLFEISRKGKSMETRKQWRLSGTEGKEECRVTTDSDAVLRG